MRHIFYIHSPITYLSAVAIARHLSLTKEDVLFICDGFNGPNNDEFTVVDLNYFYSGKNRFTRTLKLIKHFNKPALLDKVIYNFTKGHPFQAYVAVLRQWEKILVSNEDCVGFHFFEEGLVHYFEEETISSITVPNGKDAWRSSLQHPRDWRKMVYETGLLLRGYNARLQALPFSYSCYTGVKDVHFFAFTESAFPLANPARKQIISFPDSGGAVTYGGLLDNSVIWIGDNGVDFYGYSSQMYCKGIEDGLICYLKERGIKKIFVKFHRGESLQMQKMQEMLFSKNGIEITIIPGDIIMELELASAKNVNLCGVYSSLLYYAAVMGHRSTSIFDYISSEYSKPLEGRNMDFYWEKVKKL
ncbi:polysialyltransferase family glycosyltransferase [Chitinophaga arvensicola]|uniref:Uncharacterized protein n=1 Tax=Chitinophaga arvensicola TaxID=29529 RepID=A0A1I0NPF6_9BACT|nr:polysialyltransferase family glycosyltransferase [Chitinophaga arvensicola]SEW03295.1 hypothetical protein SAMN04488122_0296 [Chitinophaga arvensicola]